MVETVHVAIVRPPHIQSKPLTNRCQEIEEINRVNVELITQITT